MPTEERIVQLIELLRQGTSDGSLKWHVTADEDTFRLTSTTANIRITRREEFDRETEQTYVVRRLSVINDKGRVIEEYSPDALARERQAILDAQNVTTQILPIDEERAKFDALYESARRSAYNTDEVLGKLMKELRQSVSAGK
jgi:hypothetical protein